MYALLKKFAQSKIALGIAFFWGLGEATFFFVVPDVFFVATAFIAPMHGIIHGLLSVLGTLCGGSIMYVSTQKFGMEIFSFLEAIPLISADLIVYIQSQIEQLGLLGALLRAPFNGLPYKVYAALAPQMQYSFQELFWATLPSRLERILLLSLIAALVGRLCQISFKKHPKKFVIGYSCLWILFYSFYTWRMTTIY